MPPKPVVDSGATSASVPQAPAMGLTPDVISQIIAATVNAIQSNPAPQNDRPPRFDLHPVPILGKSALSFTEWYQRAKDRASYHGWGDMLIDHTAQLDKWQTAKSWLIQAVAESDFHLVHSASSWLDAIANLKAAHTVDDALQFQSTLGDLWSMKLETGEKPSDIVKKAQTIASVLHTITGAPFPEDQLVAAILKCVKQNLVWKNALETIQAAGVTAFSMQSLQSAFSCFSDTTPVPGAMSAQQVTSLIEKHMEVAFANFARSSNNQGSYRGRGGNRNFRGGRTSASDSRSHPYGRGASTYNRGRGGAQQQRGGAHIVCYNCDRPGHTAPECWHNCSICNSDQHKATKCPKKQNGRPSQPAHRPSQPAQRPSQPARKFPKKSARANAAVAESELAEEEEEGGAHMAIGEWEEPPSLYDSLPSFRSNSAPSNAPSFDVLGSRGMATSMHVRSTASDKTVWYTDSGATHHFTPIRAYLFNYVSDVKPVFVKVANNQFAKRSGVGSLLVKTVVEGVHFSKEIPGVWHMPTFSHGLLSTQALKRSGCWLCTGRNGDMRELIFDNKDVLWMVTEPKGKMNVPIWEVLVAPSQKSLTPDNVAQALASTKVAPNAPDTQLLASGAHPDDFMFAPTPTSCPMPINTLVPTAPLPTSDVIVPYVAPIPVHDGVRNFISSNRATDKETPALWHQRLGHVSMHALQKLVQEKKLSGIRLPVSQFRRACSEKCQVCIMAKHNRSPFRSRRERAANPMDCLHSDTCGPYPVKSLGNGLYCTTLLDECAGFAGVSIMKNKADIPDKIKHNIILWENKTGRKCKMLFTDRGGEYVGEALKTWCAEKGIIHHYSVPRTPEQNGKAERLNQTLNNIMRSLLFQYNTYAPLWSFAMVYACHLYNISLNTERNMTRYEAFLGKVPDVSNLRTFGCKVYARVAETARKKLDPKSQIGIFLGPETNGPGYKILVTNNKARGQKYAVHIVRDIYCFESLKSVTGAQDVSQLYWQGHIPLPLPQTPMEAEPLEPLTGEPAVQPLHMALPQLQASLDRLGASGSGLTPPSHYGTTGTRLAPLLEGGTRPPVASSTVVAAPLEQRALQDNPGQHGMTLGVETQAHDSSMHPIVRRSAGPPVKHPPTPAAPVTRTEVLAHGGIEAVGGNKTVNCIKRVHWNPQLVGERSGVVKPRPVATNPAIARLAPSGEAAIAQGKRPTWIGKGPAGTSKRPLGSTIVSTLNGLSCSVGTHGQTQSTHPVSVVLGKRTSELEDDEEDAYNIQPTAFMAEAPFPAPPIDALPYSRTALEEGLLRHHNVAPLTGHVMSIRDVDPTNIPATLKQALEGPYAHFWAKAIIDEYLSIIGNHTWLLVDHEPWMKVIPCKWVFTIKVDANGVPVRFKARLVAGGHKQEEGIDFEETYAPVSRLATMRTLLAVAANRAWKVHQIDITTAFLHGELDIDVFMKQPPGFVDGVNHVCKLQKTLYGLKQAPRAWYQKLKASLSTLGFIPVSADSSFWLREVDDCAVYLTSVVDDMLVTSHDESLTLKLINDILTMYPGKHSGIVEHFNGMKVSWIPGERVVVLTQPGHIQKIADEYKSVADLTIPHLCPLKPHIKLCKGGSSENRTSSALNTKIHHYRALLGSMMFIGCSTRPDITFGLNQCARYSNDPTVEHWNILIGILRYLIATINWGIKLGHGLDMGKHIYSYKTPQAATAFADANHGTGIDDKKSITGMVFFVYGGAVNWSSKVQSVTSISTTESEFRALSEASREALWLTKIVKLFKIPCAPFTIYGDSQGAIAAIKNHTDTKHTRHIEIHHQFMKDRVIMGDLTYDYVSGKLNPADVFTKALSIHDFRKCRLLLGMVELQL
jgi:transposase InsO family protein